jgi:hypothetical protein
VVRATELLQDLKTRNEDGTSVEGV